MFPCILPSCVPFVVDSSKPFVTLPCEESAPNVWESLPLSVLLSVLATSGSLELNAATLCVLSVTFPKVVVMSPLLNVSSVSTFPF